MAKRRAVLKEPLLVSPWAAQLFASIQDAILDLNLNFFIKQKLMTIPWQRKQFIVLEGESDELYSGVYAHVYAPYACEGYTFSLVNKKAPKELHDMVSSQIETGRGSKKARLRSTDRTQWVAVEKSPDNFSGWAQVLCHRLLAYEKAYPVSLELFQRLEQEQAACKWTEKQIKTVVRLALKMPHGTA